MKSKEFSALGTINIITAYGIKSAQATRAAEKRVQEIEHRMSAFTKGSDIVAINKQAGVKPRKIHRDTLAVLKRGLEFSKDSKGAFDMTIRPLTALWGFGHKDNFIPEKQEIHKIMKLVDYKALILDEAASTAYLQHSGQAIDLGGIAKGYAADEVKRILLEYEITNALINLGGNIVTIGSKPDGSPWRIGIQNPLAERGEYVGSLETRDQTIVTSGSNERFFIKDGIRYHHILDPRTGYPVQNQLLSVTVICQNSMDADALTTALFVLGPEAGLPLLQSVQAEAIILTQNQEIFLTAGLKNSFKRSGSDEKA
ncbi:MAG: FAD:protein FMN transferase [Clostridia bacterium]